MRFRTAVIWNAVSQFGYSGVTLLSTIILARLLTPDDFGIIGIVTIFIAFSQMMVDSEMGGALLRKKEVNIADYSTLFYYNLIVSLVLYALLYFLAPLIADFYHRPPLIGIVRILSLTIIIHAFRVVQRIILYRDLNFKVCAIINVVTGLLSLGVAVLLAYKGYGYWALVWQQVCIAIFGVIFMAIYTRFRPKLVFSKKSFRYQFSFGISLLGSDTIKTIANNISTNIIAKISTLQFTGYYTQTSRLSNFCQSTISSILDQSVFPMLAKFDDVIKVRQSYHKIIKMMCLGLIPTSILFILLAHPIIEIVLGKEWVVASNMFRILSLAILPVSLQALCRNIMKTTGNTRQVFHIEVFKSILVIVMLLGSTFWGNIAVIWALVIAQTICCGLWMVYTEKELNNHISSGKIS